MFASCSIAPNATERTSEAGYDVIVIDSCEYIEVDFCKMCVTGYYSLTHKGNCKYCKIRKNN